MSRRISTRVAASAGSSSTLSVATPASKRRRKDSGPAPPVASQSSDSLDAAKPGSKAERPTSSDVAHCAVMVEVPDGFSLSQAACSYGYYLVPPNLWKPCKNGTRRKDSGTFSRPLRFGKLLANTARCTISQVPSSEHAPTSNEADHLAPEQQGSTALRVDVESAEVLTESDKADIRAQVVRMFQTTIDLEPWHRLSPEAKKRGYGRLFRSPTVFEDMVKSITGCNMKFQGTIRMNRLLCEQFGRDQAFPTPEDLEGVQPEDLKEKAKVGYRADRILKLAQNFRDGTVDPDWLEAPGRTREEVCEYVKNLSGFGAYAAGNVAMLLGFYDEVPLDSETVRHFKDYHGVITKNVKEVASKATKEYLPFAPYQFLQYWYEMILWYEKKRGTEVDQWDAGDFPY